MQTCFRDNELELMLHRRLLVDDHWGVGEALNETACNKGLVARGKHYLLFDFDQDEAFRRSRLLSNEIYVHPVITFDIENKKRGTSSSTKIEKHGIEMPPNVNLLTLEPVYKSNEYFANNSFLLRFEHLFDVNEHEILSLPAKIPMKPFIEQFFDTEIKSIQETTLGGDRLKEAGFKETLQWNSRSNRNGKTLKPRKGFGSGSISEKDFEEIEIQPMEIRTFIVELYIE